jgi:hypothetical protein
MSLEVVSLKAGSIEVRSLGTGSGLGGVVVLSIRVTRSVID